MIVLKLTNVEKKFGDFLALNKINLELKKGEVHGFIGPNGAGKSTTIRTILGIYKANKGSIKIFGYDAWKDSVKVHSKIAYVPGDVNLWNNLTGIQVINMLLGFNGKIDKKRRDYYIKIFNLDTSKKCRSYSKGNRQKVALIAAFASDAELLIFDEPTSGLDPLMESVFKKCLREEKEAGKTILLSSHILSEVEELCDRVSIIRKGEIIETGTLTDLRHISRTNIELISDISIDTLKNVGKIYNLLQDNNTKKLKFQVDTESLTEVLKIISLYHTEDIKINPLSLEELFEYYYHEA